MSLAVYRDALVASIVAGGAPPPAVRGDYDVYRRMARGRLEGLIADALPRTTAALGDRWGVVFDAFLMHVSSPYLRDEVARFASAVPADPPWLPALAALETAMREVAHLPAPAVEPVPLSLDRVLPFASVWRRVESAYRLEETDEFVSHAACGYLVYRDGDDVVQVLRCDGLQASQLAAICDGLAPLDAVRHVAAQAGVPVDGAAVDTLVALVHALLERGVFAVLP